MFDNLRNRCCFIFYALEKHPKMCILTSFISNNLFVNNKSSCNFSKNFHFLEPTIFDESFQISTTFVPKTGFSPPFIFIYSVLGEKIYDCGECYVKCLRNF